MKRMNSAVAIGGPADGKVLEGIGQMIRVPTPPEPGGPPGFGSFEYTLALVGRTLFWRPSSVSDADALAIVFGRYGKLLEIQDEVAKLERFIDGMAENDDHFAWELAAALGMDLEGATPGSIRYDAIRIIKQDRVGKVLAAAEKAFKLLSKELKKIKLDRDR